MIDENAASNEVLIVVLQTIFDLAPFPKNSENHEKPKLTEASVFTEASVTSVFHEFLHFFRNGTKSKMACKTTIKTSFEAAFSAINS